MEIVDRFIILLFTEECIAFVFCAVTFDGETRMNQPLQPMQLVVEGLLSNGLHLLAGAPKPGERWLALWLSVTVAKGESVWDNTVKQGTTRSRIKRQSADSENSLSADKCPPLAILKLFPYESVALRGSLFFYAVFFFKIFTQAVIMPKRNHHTKRLRG